MVTVSKLVDVLRMVAADPMLDDPRAEAGAVAAYLYGRHYCRPGQAEHVPAGGTAFLDLLRDANPLTDRQGARCELVTPGHYFMLGREPVSHATGRQVRFYWNVGAGGAGALLTRLGAALARRRIRFQAKVPVSANGYDRADAGVLYAAAEDVAAMIDLLMEAHHALRPLIRPDVPLFTRRLADGLGFAESPQTGESFGLQRCRLMAEGLVSARTAGLTVEDAMAARLADFGIRADRPDLNPGSVYPYDFGGFAP